MKTHSLISTLVIAFISFSTASYSQVSATAVATATVITPISITWATDMSFGKLAVNATGGYVDLTPGSGITANNGVKLVTGGTVTAASFTVLGTANLAYSISLPGTVTLTNTVNSGQTMLASAFISSPTPTGTLDGSGSQMLYVGARLSVPGSQLEGIYNSTPFTVTVNYN
jgi:hypothetical protein